MPISEDSPEVPEASDPGASPGSTHAPSDTPNGNSGEAETPHVGYSDEWSQPGTPVSGTVITPPAPPPPPVPVAKSGGTGSPPKPPDPPDEPGDEEEGMARMSFLEHLEELRKRILLALGGVGIAFFGSLIFSNQLWSVVEQPAVTALRNLHVNPPTLKLISPMDTFQIIWMKLPILCAIFIASPWILYQVWAFIAPGLYKRERRLAAPFVISSAGLFILGGMFAYFVAFRYGLEFLMGLGIGQGIDPAVNVNEYYDLFVDVMLGVGVIFEIPVLLFLLTLIRVVSPAFLVRHSRYAILGIVTLAAIITPTGDVFNLALFATPMIILFYLGIFASYILVLRREKRRFPWGTFIRWTLIVLVSLLVIGFFVARYYGYHPVLRWPIFIR